MIAKHGFDPMSNHNTRALLAGDGIVHEINCPSISDCKNIKLSRDKFRNRKGVWGIINQAFCDSNGIFRFWETS